MDKRRQKKCTRKVRCTAKPREVIVVSDSDSDTIEVDPRAECVVCMDARADALVLPCMHQIVCTQCAREMQRRGRLIRCVLCQRDITSVLHDET